MNLAPPETLAWLEQFGFKRDLNVKCFDIAKYFGGLNSETTD